MEPTFFRPICAISGASFRTHTHHNTHHNTQPSSRAAVSHFYVPPASVVWYACLFWFVCERYDRRERTNSDLVCFLLHKFLQVSHQYSNPTTTNQRCEELIIPPRAHMLLREGHDTNEAYSSRDTTSNGQSTRLEKTRHNFRFVLVERPLQLRPTYTRRHSGSSVIPGK